MRFSKNISLFFLTAFASISLSAQSNKTSFLYEHESNFGILLHNKGLGLSAQFTKHRTADNYRLFDINLYTLKHPKEIKLPNPLISNSRPYVYGKKNALIALKLNYGARRILADKIVEDGVRLNLNYSVGPLVGLVKPVYYNVRVQSADINNTNIPAPKQETFQEDNETMQENTIGYANFFYHKSISESSFILGANAKASLSFEWGKEDDKFYSLEGGVMIDAFPKDVPIFAYINNDKVFINLFLTLSYGTRR